MSRATFTLFDDNRLLHQSDLPEAGTNDLLAFSGLLQQAINVEDVQSARTLWVCVGAREGEVTVTIAYFVAGVQSFTVVPGRPLVIETISTSVDELLSIVVTPSGAPTVEILVYPGAAEEPPVVPLDAILVLNAASGLSETEGFVDSWADVRAGSVAPGAFLPIGTISPRFILSNSLFNGRSTVQFERLIDARLQSSDPAATFEAMATGDFTIAMVCSFPDEGSDQVGVSNASGADGGITMGVDGAFRSAWRRDDDSGSPNNEGTIAQELKPEPLGNVSTAMVIVFRYDFVTGRMTLYRQDREGVILDAGSLATSVVEQLVLGGRPDGTGLAGLVVADLRFWARHLTDEERNGYITYGVSEYGVDDTEAVQAPEGALLMLRANRGVVGENSVLGWSDTRPEAAALGDFSPPNNVPYYGTDPGILNGRPFMSLHVEENSGSAAQLVYNGDASDFDILSGTDPATLVLILRKREANTSVSSRESIITMGVGTGARNNVLFGNTVGTPSIGPWNLTGELLDDSDADVTISTFNNAIRAEEERIIYWQPQQDSQPDWAEVGFRAGTGGGGNQLPHNITPSTTVRTLIIGPPVGEGGSNVNIAEVRIYPRELTTGDLNLYSRYAEERFGVVE